MLHPYATRDHPPPPASQADDLVQGDGPFWALALIQPALREERLAWEVTPKAEDDLMLLGWDSEDVDAFIQTLHAGPCVPGASQWCLEPKTAKPPSLGPRILRLSDVYIMGFHRFRRIEQPRGHPKIYFKFTVTEYPHRLLIYSLHHERKVIQPQQWRKS